MRLGFPASTWKALLGRLGQFGVGINRRIEIVYSKYAYRLKKDNYG